VNTAGSPRVLVIGLDPYRFPGPWDPEPVAEAIEAGLTKFAEHVVNVETCLIGLDGSDDVEAVVGNALRALTWECVTVGGGLRHSDDQVELLEQIVNLVRQHAPDAAIAFNSNPATTYEAAAQWIS
jgi:phosphoribosylformimino-5-aminoimidazole carboxamide ribonucleotide (ProFAR) isomerase